MRISFAIIGHNEEKLIEGCLESVKDIAYEIIYADCESQDRSLNIAMKYTDKIFRVKNDLNLNVNKQFAIDKCEGDWVFYIDPDERLTGEIKKEIMEVLNKTDFNGFLMPRRNYYFGKWLRYGGKYPDRQLRLFKKGKAKFECLSIHERIKVEGKVGELKNPFDHIVIEDTDRLAQKIYSYIYRTSYEMDRLKIDNEKRLNKSIQRFFTNYFLKLGFFDGRVGFFVAIIDLFNGFLSYFKIKELKDNIK
ncbi:MAG TPA: glycosyltransferase family 2 protein [Elusimicrobiales bacterium]|nr:glycosyltransferase family 2 protein [Elusimicrobiales bacterium]HOL62776.1 glycosyltransferase family 2 protein [Elusimicrobiales bacterium]HPO94841.1 glycosyltransferase family 2 protein [Elusimicrobiales bacterium]